MAIETYFKNIADAIREKAGTSGLITPAQMPQAIVDIPSGGGGLTPLTPIATDWRNGYAEGSTYWKTPTNNRSDIYELINGHSYVFGYGSKYGYFRRISFFTSNPMTATANITGGEYSSNSYNNDFSYLVGSKKIYSNYIYMVFTKDHTRDGIPTFVFDFNDLP